MLLISYIVYYNFINHRPTDSAMKKLLRISTESSEVLKLATRESFTVFFVVKYLKLL